MSMASVEFTTKDTKDTKVRLPRISFVSIVPIVVIQLVEPPTSGVMKLRLRCAPPQRADPWPR